VKFTVTLTNGGEAAMFDSNCPDATQSLTDSGVVVETEKVTLDCSQGPLAAGASRDYTMSITVPKAETPGTVLKLTWALDDPASSISLGSVIAVSK
jgi:hypothetical protein